jgi:glycerol-3-phosphate dehydrogenase
VQIRFLEIVTPDLDKTCETLAAVHGVTFGEPTPELGNARTASLKGGGVISVRAPMRATESPVVRPYLLVDDIAAAVKEAEARGAVIRTRTRVLSAQRGEDGLWLIRTQDAETDETRETRARALVNAGGPWVKDVIQNTLRQNSSEGVRLVRGSHIVTRKLYDHDKCYFFQGEDGRIIFAIPYETDFTLIGTTDAEHEDVTARPECTDEEAAYLCRFASEYFKTPVTQEDIVWTYSGVRPLYDDGAKSATAATRDYVLTLDDRGGAPLLNVFGGKITTYRKLAEAAMARIAPFFEGAEREWTAGVALPGGDFAVDGVAQLTADLRGAYPFLDAFWAGRLIRAYGTEAAAMLGDAKTPEELGPDFGATLTGREVAWMMRHEYARTAEDVVWRRTRLGLRLTAGQIAALDAWMAAAATQDDAGTAPAKSSAALRA